MTTTCWICGAPLSVASSICGSCRDRQRAPKPETERDVTPTELTAPAPISSAAVPHRRTRPLGWASKNRRGLLTAVLSGGVAVLLVVGISFSWANASDRASQLEHTVNAREKDLDRADRRFEKLRKEQRALEKSLREATDANTYLEAAVRGTQSDLQRATGALRTLQSQVEAANLRAIATQACLDGVSSAANVRGQANRDTALAFARLANC